MNKKHLLVVMEVSPLDRTVVGVVALFIFLHPRTRITSRRLERQLGRNLLDWSSQNLLQTVLLMSLTTEGGDGGGNGMS